MAIVSVMEIKPCAALRACLFLCLTAPAAAQQADALPLDQAVELALKNDVSLSQKETTLEQAKRAAAFSWNALMPNITISGSISNAHPIKPAGDATESWSASGSASLQLTAAIPARMALASVRHKTEEQNYREARLQLVSAVSAAFNNLLAAKANIEIQRDNLELTRTQYEQTRRNYERGLASELEHLNAEYAFRVAGPALDDAVNKYESDLASFMLALGLDPKSPREPAGQITATALALPAPDELSRLYLQNRPDVQKARLALETAKLTQTVDWLANRAPSITLSESIGLDPPSAAALRQAGKDVFALDPEDITASGRFSIGVSIPITAWIPGSTQSLAIKTDSDAVRAAQKTFASVLGQAELDIKNKTEALEQYFEKIESAGLNYRITLRAYELSEQGYRSGLVSQTDLLAARQRMVTARQAELQAQIAYTSAVYSLASALGLGADAVLDLYRQY